MKNLDSFIPPPASTPSPAFGCPGWICFGLAMIAIVVSWFTWGGRFFDRVIPFYDSESYQEGYLAVAGSAGSSGSFTTAVAVWRESGNNVVLYKFFAALFGRIIPTPKIGLFVYLFAIHVAASAALYRTTRRLDGSAISALLAVAVWWSTGPFGLLRDGVGDQRMDLASGSFCLLVAALGLDWIDRPALSGALMTGLATALAALHRPVMTVVLAAMGAILLIAALFRHSAPVRWWLKQIGCALLPVMIVAFPWLLFHLQDLRTYYLEFNVAVGNAHSWTEAAVYNLREFSRAFGLTAALLLGIGFTAIAIRKKIDRQRLIVVALLVIAPLAVLTITKSVGNGYVTQMALGLPALAFATFKESRSEKNAPRLFYFIAASACLAGTVAAAPFRLERSLAQERPGARAEVERVVRQIATVRASGRVAAFHDLPVNLGALISVARDLHIPLTAGTAAYHPFEFGLTADQATDVASPVVVAAVARMIQRVKQSDQLLLIPTKETEFRLWAGQFSHQILPEMRNQVRKDPSFTSLLRTDGVAEVTFEVFLISTPTPP